MPCSRTSRGWAGRIGVVELELEVAENRVLASGFPPPGLVRPTNAGDNRPECGPPSP